MACHASSAGEGVDGGGGVERRGARRSSRSTAGGPGSQHSRKKHKNHNSFFGGRKVIWDLPVNWGSVLELLGGDLRGANGGLEARSDESDSGPQSPRALWKSTAIMD